MSNYEESLSRVKDLDDKQFPDWLFKPVFNDFNDDYYEKSFADSQLQSQIKKVRRRYNDFFQWQDAIVVYNEYMQTMIDKWGSMKVIRNSLEAGTMPDFIPAKPKLKNNKKNRLYLRTGFVPSRRFVELPLSDEEMIAIARQSFPTTLPDEKEIEEWLTYKPTKAEKQAYERIMNQTERANRRANMYRSVGNSRGTDFIVEYLNQTKQGVYGSSGHRKKNGVSIDNMSLVDRAKELIRISSTPQHVLDEEMATETTYYGGRIVNRKYLEQIEILKVLYEEGFNVIGSMSGKMDKKSVKMIRSQIGATEPMTKKEMKKLKKRNRKDQKRIQRRQDEDAALSNMLLGNKIKGSKYRSDSLSMRMQDLYPDN